jgi:hypothetical protein
MINKKSLWFLTLFSLILVLSIYYITMPSELLLTGNTNISKEENEPTINIEESDLLVALRVESDEEISKELDELETILTNSNSTTNGSGLTVGSDTPQGRVTKQSILAGNYATTTTGNEVNNTTTTSSGSDSEENYTKRMKGNSGVSATAQKMIEQYRDNIRAIDKEIIARLEPLFMGLY